MSLQRYLWHVYCVTEGQYVSTISDTKPTTCPNDPLHTIDPVATAIIQSRYTDITADSYLNLESQLADNQALKINASDPNGGIDIDAGFGGITVDTTNAISLNANAASNFTTTMGNLTLEATAGLVNIDAVSGINLGNGTTTTPIDIGSSANSKTINIGNDTGTTGVTLRSGTGKINLNSADTDSDAIVAYSAGGIDVDAIGLINIASANNTVSAITLDSSFGGGGMVLSSGAQGVILTSNGGPIALGSWSGGDIYIGTAAVARTISIGNTTTTTSVNIQSGTGGIVIGNDANTGEIQIGNVANDKTVIIGNNSTNSRLFLRCGNSGCIKHQSAENALSDADHTLTIADIIKNIFTIPPTLDRTLTLDTAVNAVAGISGVQINDSIDFTIINNSIPADEAIVTIVPGTGGTLIGNGIVAPFQNSIPTYLTSGSGTFRLRFTNVTGGTEAYTLYRVY